MPDDLTPERVRKAIYARGYADGVADSVRVPEGFVVVPKERALTNPKEVVRIQLRRAVAESLLSKYEAIEASPLGANLEQLQRELGDALREALRDERPSVGDVQK